MNALELQLMSEADTARLGSVLAPLLQPGDVVALNGELGAGKTTLVRSLVAGLQGDSGEVNSPTFVIVQQYAARLPVYHIDAYRLADVDEFLALGGDELLDGDGVCLIEWAARIAEVLPEDRLKIDLEAISPQSRRLVVCATGERSARIVAQLQESWRPSGDAQ